ncbi:uncharacterized protein ARMOST_06031 [Armillaria ostoyae]|uniref:Uncharacterized protein n=1 Tax=Armillaria ostoyae TaxID=47428 RepID=A0A284R1V4_ARMOS|nr:uncharacterized protein ARMOST_06031 [Armillaria ostoyae]
MPSQLPQDNPIKLKQQPRMTMRLPPTVTRGTLLFVTFGADASHDQWFLERTFCLNDKGVSLRRRIRFELATSLRRLSSLNEKKTSVHFLLPLSSEHPVTLLVHHKPKLAIYA